MSTGPMVDKALTDFALRMAGIDPAKVPAPTEDELCPCEGECPCHGEDE